MEKTVNEAGNNGGSVTEVLPKMLKALAEGYEKADDYNRPAIEYTLRKVYAFFTSKP
jgi:hypothetical protein